MTNEKFTLIKAFRALIESKPGFTAHNYGSTADYRTDRATAEKDKIRALQALDLVARAHNITAELIEGALKGGRFSIEREEFGGVRIDYTPWGAYPTEYRPAIAGFLNSLLQQQSKAA